MKDYPYERYLRDARILLIFEVIVLYRVLSNASRPHSALNRVMPLPFLS